MLRKKLAMYKCFIAFDFYYLCVLLAGALTCEYFFCGKPLKRNFLIEIVESEIRDHALESGYKENLVELFKSKGFAEKVCKYTLDILKKEKIKIFAMCDLVIDKEKIDCSWLLEQCKHL